ncbi:MAG: caspase family protein [Bacteroidales bacterium]|nr:caspase family protein [Bacteroidales bacterium]MBN2757574.1 caspase family protein [Bacteroidales bacterium]
MKKILSFIFLILLSYNLYAQQEGCLSGNCDNGYGTWAWSSGSKYTGDWLNKQKHGQGTYYYSNGDIYKGEYKYDQMEGYGTYTYGGSGTIYLGYWKNSKFHGRGTLTFGKDTKWYGDKYMGDWKEDLKDGWGTYYFANGDKYEGQWKNNKYNGEGTYFYISGKVEKGFWVDNELSDENNLKEGCISGDCDNGYGTYVFKSGQKYVGNWVKLKRNGQGINYWPTGEWYSGEWKEDSRHGQGINYYENGEKYDGQWLNDKKNGYGSQYYVDGDVKTGMWEDNKYTGTGNNKTGCISGNCDNGYGVYVWSSGEKYVGDWTNSMRNGKGTNTWTDGEEFDGNWKNDKRHGYGKQKYKSGSEKTGFWENGIYKGTNTINNTGCISGDCNNGYGTYVQTSGNKYVGTFKNGTFEGQGSYTFADGGNYVGLFQNGMYHGQGTYTFANNQGKYVGDFKNGKYNGLGTFYYPDGRTQAGKWQDNKYVGTAQSNLTPPEVSWITPAYTNTNATVSEAKIKLCIKSKEEPQNIQVYINDELQITNAVRGFSVVTSNCDYTFDKTVKLKPGTNNIKVVVKNGAGEVASSIRTITFETQSNKLGKRYALVIGQSNYLSSPLRNPVNDANDIAAELKKLGFDVMVFTNISQNDMKKHIRTFGDKLAANKGTGLFFYAGHGMQVSGENYLIPVDAKIEKEQDVELEAVNLKRLLGEMEYAQNDLNIVILDACRNNPFARSFRSGGNQGLASTLAPTGTFIAYATAPGSVAADGTDKNGLYTQELLKALKQKGLRIEDVFKEVRKNVYEKSAKKQVPWENSSIFGDFYFSK